MADGYSRRMAGLVVKRGIHALAMAGTESLPPQSPRRSRSPSRGRGGGKGAGKPKPESRFHTISSRGSNDPNLPNEGFSENLADLVRYGTIAHRLNMGNVFWVGLNPERQRPSRISMGSHLRMASKTGIVHVFEGIHSGQIARGHIDLSLKHWLSSGTVASRVGACYTYPSMGGFFGTRAAVILPIILLRREDVPVHGSNTPLLRGRDKVRTRRTGASTSSSGENNPRIDCGSPALQMPSYISTNTNGSRSVSLPPLIKPKTHSSKIPAAAMINKQIRLRHERKEAGEGSDRTSCATR